MLTDIGEYIVGAHLQLVKGCDFVDYNVRPPGGGLKGLGELDVVGLNFKSSTAYLCEVTTHIRGLLYKDNETTVIKIKDKHERQKEYAQERLSSFSKHIFMFWSPVVPVGYRTRGLEEIEGLKLVINGEYKRMVEELQAQAKKIHMILETRFLECFKLWSTCVNNSHNKVGNAFCASLGHCAIAHRQLPQCYMAKEGL